MSLVQDVIQSIQNEIHRHMACSVATIATVLAPYEDTFSRIATGVITGILVWCLTRLISMVYKKLIK